MIMSRLWTHGHTDGHVKVEQYSAEAESAKIYLAKLSCRISPIQLHDELLKVSIWSIAVLHNNLWSNYVGKSSWTPKLLEYLCKSIFLV